MNILGFFIFVAGTVSLGTALLKLMRTTWDSRAETLAYAWLVGALAIAFVFFLTSWAGLHWYGMIVIGLSIAGLIGAYLSRDKVSGGLPPFSPSRHHSPAEILGALVLVLFCLMMIWDSARNPLVSIDGRITWAYHAKLFIDTGTVVPRELEDARFAIGHTQYPFLLPAVEALAGMASGGFSDWSARLITALFGISLIVLVRENAAKSGSSHAHWITVACLLVPTSVSFESGAMDCGTADSTLMAYAAAATFCLIRTNSSRPLRQAVLFSAFLGAGAALSKNEGLFLGPLLGLTALLSVSAGNRTRHLTTWIGIWLVAIIPWLWVRHYRANYYEENYLQYLLEFNLPRFLEKLPAVSHGIFDNAVLRIHQSAIGGWLLLVATALTVYRRKLDPPSYLLIASWIYLGIIYLALIVSPWPNRMQADAAFNRILTHVAPMIALALCTYTKLTEQSVKNDDHKASA